MEKLTQKDSIEPWEGPWARHTAQLSAATSLCPRLTHPACSALSLRLSRDQLHSSQPWFPLHQRNRVCALICPHPQVLALVTFVFLRWCLEAVVFHYVVQAGPELTVTFLHGNRQRETSPQHFLQGG